MAASVLLTTLALVVAGFTQRTRPAVAGTWLGMLASLAAGFFLVASVNGVSDTAAVGFLTPPALGLELWGMTWFGYGDPEIQLRLGRRMAGGNR
jgi:hypothetical protein